MNILLTEPVHIAPSVLQTLSALGDVRQGPFTRAQILDAMPETDVLFVRLSHAIDREVLNAAPRLRVIASATTGINHIDLDSCRARGIEVVTLRGETAFLDAISSTAEHAFGLLLACTRALPAAHRQAVQAGFLRGERIGRELKGKTLAIVGYGRLGRKMAKYTVAFNMRVLAVDPYYQGPWEPAESRPLAEALAAADAVSLHASYTPGLQPIIDAAAIAAMKDNAIFINTARGELIDEHALLERLRTGNLTAALDVADHEVARPDPDPLVRHAATHDNLILTPHIGGATIEGLHAAERFVTDKLVSHLTSHAA